MASACLWIVDLPIFHLPSKLVLLVMGFHLGMCFRVEGTYFFLSYDRFQRFLVRISLFYKNHALLVDGDYVHIWQQIFLDPHYVSKLNIAQTLIFTPRGTYLFLQQSTRLFSSNLHLFTPYTLLRKLHLESKTKTNAMTGALHTTTTTTTTTQQVPIVTNNTKQIAFETVSKLLSNTRSLSTIKRSPQTTDRSRNSVAPSLSALSTAYQIRFREAQEKGLQKGKWASFYFFLCHRSSRDSESIQLCFNSSYAIQSVMWTMYYGRIVRL